MATGGIGANAVKTCLHTVSYAGFWGQAALDLDAIVDRAADLGFDGIMLMAKRPHASVLDMTAERIAALRERLEARGLVCACLAGYTNFTADAEHPDVPTVEMQIHHVGELGRIARGLGCDVVRVFTAFESHSLTYPAAWSRCVTAIRECADRVAEYRVSLAVQNHHDVAVASEAMVELLVEVDRPNCGAAFDAWAPALHGDDPAEAVRAVLPMLRHTTVADYLRLRRFRYVPPLVNYERQTDTLLAVPMGEGFIDYKRFLHVLADGGYEGFVGYEMCSPLRGGGSLENLDRCACRFVEFVAGLGR